jgi:hypothetical protein
VTTHRDAKLPPFDDDPYQWFAEVRRVLVEERRQEILGALEPASWINGDGNGWRLVRTPSGVEVRPELANPFLRLGDSPRITAIAIGEDEVCVELSAKSGRWIDRFSQDAFDVAALGRAMLDSEELPHDNLPRLFPRPSNQGGKP